MESKCGSYTGSVARFCVTDPTELLRRAAELTERADHEEDIETRERLKAKNGRPLIQPLSLLLRTY